MPLKLFSYPQFCFKLATQNYLLPPAMLLIILSFILMPQTSYTSFVVRTLTSYIIARIVLPDAATPKRTAKVPSIHLFIFSVSRI